MYNRISRPLRNLAIRSGVYHKLRYSRLYEAFLLRRNPRYFSALQDDLVFYKSVLRLPCNLIFDIGANQGDKTWVFRQIARAVVAVEPDSYCWSALTERFRSYHNVQLENVALGEKESTETFYVEEKGSAYNTLSAKHRTSRLKIHRTEAVRTVVVYTLDQLVAKYGCPDFAKIDVEGYELPVMRGLSSRIPVISFESNLPAFRKEILEILTYFEPAASSRFNLRSGNASAFVFPTQKTLAEIREFITKANGTFDIFVFQNCCGATKPQTGKSGRD